MFAPTYGCPLLGGRPQTPSPCCQTTCVPGKPGSDPQGWMPGSGPCLLPPPQVAVAESSRLWGPWPVPASRRKSPVTVPAFSWWRLRRTGFWIEISFCPLSGTGWRPRNSFGVSTTTFQFVECSFHFTVFAFHLGTLFMSSRDPGSTDLPFSCRRSVAHRACASAHLALNPAGVPWASRCWAC